MDQENSWVIDRIMYVFFQCHQFLGKTLSWLDISITITMDLDPAV